MNNPIDPSRVLTAKLPGEAVLLDLETKRYFQLNETAARIWDLMQQGATRTAIAATLTAEFEVDVETAERAVERVIQRLADAGLTVALD